jgi:ATP-binding cassette subfamily B protein
VRPRTDHQVYPPQNWSEGQSMSDSIPRRPNVQLNALKYIPKAIISIWHVSGILVSVSLLQRLTLAALIAAILWISKLLIDAVLRVQSRPANSWAHLWEILAAEFALVILTDILSRSSGVTDTLLSDKFVLKLSTQLIIHSNTLDLEAFENPLFQDKLERARTQLSAQLAVLTNVAQLVQTLIGALILCIAVSVYVPWLVIILLIALLPVAGTDTYFASLIHAAYRKRTSLRRTMDYFLTLCTSPSTTKEVKAFNLGHHFLSEYSELGEQLRKENAVFSRTRHAVGAFLATLGTAAYYGGYAYLVSMAVHRQISIGTLVFLSGSFQRTKWQMQEMFAAFSKTLDQAMYLGDAFEFFQMEPSIKPPDHGALVRRPISRGLEFRDVSFTYAGSATPAVSELSFCIRPGETVALVGSNGAGKTTITKLIARLYEPTRGSILLDGIDLRDYDIESLRKAISIMFQDFVRYELTAGDNIGFGNVEFKDDVEKLDRAAHAGGASSIIDRLPGHYGQPVGRRFEGGIDLSGGEWQKLAMSRSYMRDAELLILDEPTAALDARNEYSLFEHLSRLTKGKMAVLVSHRLPTVRMAHKILVMRAGRIIEQGTHESLMAVAGEYAALFDLQATGYRSDFVLGRRP